MRQSVIGKLLQRGDRERIRASPGPQRAGLGPTSLVLEVSHLSIAYGSVEAVRGLDFRIDNGECFALVGESGCGKSTVARSILGLLPRGAIATGSIRVCGREVVGASLRELRAMRGQLVGYVAQDPFAACDPLRTVGHHVEEAWRATGQRIPGDDAVSSRLTVLGIDNAAARVRNRPHQWSGGMLQRATIAAATVHGPSLTIADEPTTALDADLAAGVLTALREASSSLLLVSHDLRLVARHADRVAVIYAGRIVEMGPSRRVLEHPRHPYTQALIAASPRPGHGMPIELAGAPPVLTKLSTGCAFASRCRHAMPRCQTTDPALIEDVACLFVNDQ